MAPIPISSALELPVPVLRRRRVHPRISILIFLFSIGYIESFIPSVPLIIRQVVFEPRPQLRLWDASKEVQEAVLQTSGLTDEPELSTTSQSQQPKFFIPNEQLEELRDDVDIVAVIESYGLSQFKRSGDNRATCICPFHDDRNPSLSIDGTRGIFKCFSCGAGGNVFNFVREYSKLEGEEISFYKTVKFVNDNFSNGFKLPLFDGYSGTSTFSQEAAAKRERILQANLAAAAFFEKSLVSAPTAGLARSHLRSRGLSAQTVRSFAIGFAPDSYFNAEQSGPSRRWGEGSLVDHLREKNFTAAEIVDAGLAILTKKRRQPKEYATNSTNTTVNLDMDFSTLMDRFRGRLVVPIFDATGAKILGFGGRILEAKMAKKSDFKSAKYLNSPETLVFQKKTILFGQHMAKKAIRYWDKIDEVPRPVVIVEGYMDCIALWQAGVREAVSCMGTALTSEQLTAAARMAGTKNGRIVICLDNDSAGKNALERICSGGLLSSLADRYPVEVRIATLNVGTKDPAEYFEQNKKVDNAEEMFREDVIENSLEWSEWYTQHLISCYDPTAARGAPGSFGAVFERLASFLSTYSNAAERIKQACELASYLAEILSKESNTTEVSQTVRIQLETDLVNKASSIANSKAAISSRIASVGGGSNTEIQAKLSTMSRGDGLSGSDESKKMAAGALKKQKGGQLDTTNLGRTAMPGPVKRTSTGVRSPRGSRARMKRPPRHKDPDLTEHFSGFDFAHETDAKWLGAVDDKGRRKNNWLVPTKPNTKGEINRLGQKKVVYFNSNEYHGHQFITPEAIAAGYQNEAVPRASGVKEKGVSSLIHINEDSMSLSAEDALLRTLLLFKSARKSMRTTLDTNYASGTEEDVEWSSGERAWLFSCLVEKQNEIPENIIGPEDLVKLRQYLSSRTDMLPGALSPPDLDCSSSNSESEMGMGDGHSNSYENKGLETDTGTIDVPKGAVETWSDDKGVEELAPALDPSYLELTSDEGETVSTHQEPHNRENSSIPSNAPQAEAGEPRTPDVVEVGTIAVPKEKEDDSINAEFVVSETTGDEEKHVTHFWGPLDQFFDTVAEVFLTPSSAYSISQSEKAELAVQEFYSHLRWASAVKKLSRKRDQWSQATSLLLDGGRSDDGGNHTSKLNSDETGGEKEGQSKLLDVDSDKLVFQNTTFSRQELTKYCTSLTEEVRDASVRVTTLADANRRLNERLMEFALTSGLSEGRALSGSGYRQLSDVLKTHMRELDKWSIPEVEEQDGNEEEPYEDMLERAQEEWGELYEDDRMWTPDDIAVIRLSEGEDTDMDHLVSEASPDDTETVEEFMSRMDSDWGWIEEQDDNLPEKESTSEMYTFDESKWDALLNGENVTISTKKSW